MPLTKIIDDNVTILQQIVDVINPLSNADYQRSPKPLFTSSIGAHIRHQLEHYQQFFRGLESGQIDYDQRPRQIKIEQDSNFAIAVSNQLIDELQQLRLRHQNNETFAVGIYHASSTNEEAHLFLPSNIERELLFLLSHCSHHLAIIAATLRYLQIEVDDLLGIAPSTIIYNKQHPS